LCFDRSPGIAAPVNYLEIPEYARNLGGSHQVWYLRTFDSAQTSLLVCAAVQNQISSSWRSLVRELVRYLLENAYIDFRGEISMEKVREFLREDDSREARSLLSKLIDDKGVDDLLITIADCLKDHIRVGITEDTLREQLTMYSES
jgi:hypothetical protein